MKAWELLKHLENGGTIYFEDAEITLNDLSGWDYDPIRNPGDYSLTKPKQAIAANKHPEMTKAMQEHRIKVWGCNLNDYIWTKNSYIHKSAMKGK